MRYLAKHRDFLEFRGLKESDAREGCALDVLHYEIHVCVVLEVSEEGD